MGQLSKENHHDFDTETPILPSQSLLNEDIQLVAQSV
jgi:hypothetical protein